MRRLNLNRDEFPALSDCNFLQVDLSPWPQFRQSAMSTEVDGACVQAALQQAMCQNLLVCTCTDKLGREVQFDFRSMTATLPTGERMPLMLGDTPCSKSAEPDTKLARAVVNSTIFGGSVSALTDTDHQQALRRQLKPCVPGDAQVCIANNAQPVASFEQVVFHGTRRACVLGIHKDGWRVPDKPVHGWRFGRGTYFAPDFRLAACYAAPDTHGDCYVLVCAVDLRGLSPTQIVPGGQAACDEATFGVDRLVQPRALVMWPSLVSTRTRILGVVVVRFSQQMRKRMCTKRARVVTV
jgi:hypothetical protein